MSEHVFHFTDSARLPWILFNQELRVSLDARGGQGFLWATTKDTLDRTSACASKAARATFERERRVSSALLCVPRISRDGPTFWPVSRNTQRRAGSTRRRRLVALARPTLRCGDVGLTAYRYRRSSASSGDRMAEAARGIRWILGRNVCF